jgi:hypothetical protein
VPVTLRIPGAPAPGESRQGMQPMANTQPVDPEKIFLQAICFQYSGTVLWHTAMARLKVLADSERVATVAMRRPTPEGTGVVLTMPAVMTPETPTLVPMLVVNAFTVELFIKCVLALDAVVPPATHALLDLFQSLSPGRQQRLETLFDEESHKAPHFGMAQEMGLSPLPTLASCLTEMNKAFVQWRYAYEFDPKSGTFSELRAALRRLILEIRPDWEPLVARLGGLPTFPAH